MSGIDKGKGKAAPVFSYDDDPADGLDMFEMRPSLKRIGKSVPPLGRMEADHAAKSSSEVIEIIESDESVVEDDDEDGQGAKEVKKKTKKKKPAKKPSVVLPEWTKGTTRTKDRSRSLKRGSTESRQSGERGEPVVVSSGDESGEMKRPKGKANDVERELTPPPQLTKAQLEKVIAPVRAMTSTMQPSPSKVPDVFDDDEPERLSDEVIRVHVNMMSDPTRHPPGEVSAKAVQQWEKRRNITIFRDGKIEDLHWAVGKSCHRESAEIVLVHNDRAIANRNLSARQLLIRDDDYLIGYEKVHWDRLEKAKRDELDYLLDGPQDDSPPSPSPSPAPAPSKTRICLRGSWGDVRIGVTSDIIGIGLAELYCTKSSKSVSIAKTLRLKFDGEEIKPETRLDETEVEDGDMIDVVIPPAYQ